MPSNYLISLPGRPSLTIAAESINDAAERWAMDAKIGARDDYDLDVLDGAQRYRIRVTMDQGHPVAGEPWGVFDVAGTAKTSDSRPVRVIEQRGQLVLIATAAAVEQAFALAREMSFTRIGVQIVPCSTLGVSDV